MTWVVQGTFGKKQKNMHLLYIMVKYNDHCENPSVQCRANRPKPFWIPSSPCCSSKFNMAYEEYSPQRFLGKTIFCLGRDNSFQPKYSMYDLSSYIWIVLGVHVGKYTSPSWASGNHCCHHGSLPAVHLAWTFRWSHWVKGCVVCLPTFAIRTKPSYFPLYWLFNRVV